MRTVTITSVMIQNGEPGNPCGCPTSLALIEAGFTGPHVDQLEMQYTDGNVRITAETPRSVRNFIREYDYQRSAYVRPFTFEAPEKEDEPWKR